jgi:hypothetical protein
LGNLCGEARLTGRPLGAGSTRATWLCCDVDRDAVGDPRVPSALPAQDAGPDGETPVSEVDAYLLVGRVEPNRRSAFRTVDGGDRRPTTEELESMHDPGILEADPCRRVLLARRRWRALFASSRSDRGGGSVSVRDSEILRLCDAVV